MRQAIQLLLALAISACGKVNTPQEIDAAVDAPEDSHVDADIDAPAPTRVHQLTAGGGRLVGATYTFEAQLGHGLDQRPIEGGTHHLKPNTAIKP